MSTKTEPYRKYVAHDGKSKFFIFFPEIAYGKRKNVVWFFSWNMLLKERKKSKIRYGPRAGQKHAKFSDQYLIINFALFNPHQNNTPVWAWKFIFEELKNLLRPIIVLWVNFQDQDEPLKITKIRFLKILKYAHFFNRQIRYPVKHQNT